MPDQNVEGYLFLCGNRTQTECFQKKLFGLTRKYWGWVEQIRIGTPLFLYNIDSKTLFGSFRARSQGKWNIDPAAWENVRPLVFPAQVLVNWDKLHEIKAAYKRWGFLRDGNLCKLTLEQTNALIDALEEAPLYDVQMRAH
ncbi:MAG: hypothetical protein HWN66_18740 [Candidatus Helarchaeota archaeon]|nr:hypothetical protein [Candidatus Helarchaeota archaeon]